MGYNIYTHNQADNSFKKWLCKQPWLIRLRWKLKPLSFRRKTNRWQRYHYFHRMEAEITGDVMMASCGLRNRNSDSKFFMYIDQ